MKSIEINETEHGLLRQLIKQPIMRGATCRLARDTFEFAPTSNTLDRIYSAMEAFRLLEYSERTLDSIARKLP